MSGSGKSPWHEWIVERVVPVTPRITSIQFRPPLDAGVVKPVAGQHLDVRLTAEDGYSAERSYSIASAPDSELVELVIEKLEDGEVSPFFHDIVQPGDAVEVRGPLGGYFIWRPEDTGPLMLLAGGSGIAPLMAMVRHWKASAATTPLLLVYSARTWADMAFADELVALQAEAPNFMFVTAVTREPARREGDLERRIDAGQIDAILSRWGHAPGQIYICGSNRFVEAATTGLLDAGLAASIIRTERYGGA